MEDRIQIARGERQQAGEAVGESEVAQGGPCEGGHPCTFTTVMVMGIYTCDKTAQN